MGWKALQTRARRLLQDRKLSSLVLLLVWSVSVWELCACVPTPFTEKRDALANFQGMYACANTTMMSEPQSIDDVRNALLSFSKVRGYGTRAHTHTEREREREMKAHVGRFASSSCDDLSVRILRKPETNTTIVQ